MFGYVCKNSYVGVEGGMNRHSKNENSSMHIAISHQNLLVFIEFSNNFWNCFSHQ
jgi:hypothetical protein